MGNQINTQPQTFKTNTVVMGSAAGLSAVSGLTVYGDISASGTIYATGAVPAKSTYTFNGAVSSFPINGYTNTTPENYLVYLDGVYQAPGTAYTLSGANIVMSQIPASGVVADVIAYQSQRGASLIPANSTSHPFDGSVASFTVNGYTDTNATNYLAYLDGVHQIPGTDYTVASNGTITFTPTPVSGVVANVIAFQSSVSMLSLSGIEPLVSTHTGTGSQTAFVIGVSGGFTNTTAASYLVIIGGLVQRPGIDYTVSSASGGTINFTAAPPSGASIVVFAYQTMPTSQSAYNAANEIAASKIDKPSSASAGQVLSYNGTSWVAASSAAPAGIVAWVNFTGTGSVGNQTINGSYNVASVAKTATGAYTITFINNLQDANYCANVSILGTLGGAEGAEVASGSTPSVSEIKVISYNGVSVLTDCTRCYVSIIR